jgi:hypothetical protein
VNAGFALAVCLALGGVSEMLLFLLGCLNYQIRGYNNEFSASGENYFFTFL